VSARPRLRAGAEGRAQGIRFHGLSITDCKKQLPPAKGGKEIILESMFWLLLTGKVPTEQQTRDLSRQLAENGELPQYAEKVIDSCVHSQYYMTTSPT
jgi:citrate synthase